MRSSERASSEPTAAAVVVGLDSITGLQTARILAARGVPVYGVVADRRHWGARTNACVEVVESPLSGPELVAPSPGSLRRLRRPGGARALHRRRPWRPSRCTATSWPLRYLLALPSTPSSTCSWTRCASPHAAEHGLPVPRTEVLLRPARRAAAAAVARLPVRDEAADKAPAWLAHTSAKAITVDRRAVAARGV